MSETEYPKEVTNDNIQHLIENAEKIKEKNLRFRYGFTITILYLSLGLPIVYGSFYLVVWLGLNNYLSFLLWFSPELLPTAFFVFLIAVMLTISLPTLAVLLLSVIWIFRRYFGYPKYEEIIFAESFIIAKYLINNERLTAKKEVGFFIALLTGFVREIIFNPKRKVYAPEFDLLRCGKNQISRMLMFSTSNISNLFMNFGLAFARNDNPEAFSNLKQLIKEIQEYGPLKGRTRRFLSGIEEYPHSIPWVISLIIIAIAILYYFLSGQHLPI
jgi:hypothetical protein